MDLDAGLNKEATLAAVTEQLLVVVKSSNGVQQLAAACSAAGQPGPGSSSSSQEVCAVEFDGWNQGEQQLQLESWKQLEPRVIWELPAAGAAVQL